MSIKDNIVKKTYLILKETEEEAEVDSPDSQYEGYSETDDKLVQQYILKDGGPIPILEMTYINKTQPRPCDKEVINLKE